MKSLLFTAFAAALFLGPVAAPAQPGPTTEQATAPFYEIHGSIRHRSELDAKSFDADADPFWFHLLRSRVQLLVRPLPNVSAVVQVQDSRLFGSGDPALGRGTLDGSARGLDLHQAYFSVDSLFSLPLTLEVGRRELAYGNERLIGAVGWSNVGRTFDAGLLALRTGDVRVDAWASQLVSMPEGGDGEQNFYGLYGTIRPAEAIGVDLFALRDDNTMPIPAGPDSGAAVLERYTVGTYLHGRTGPVGYTGEFGAQFGDIAAGEASPRNSIGAYMAGVSVDVLLVESADLKVGALFTLLSGDDNPSDGRAKTFNTLFATNHKFYGFMDYFPALSGALGLRDLGASVSLRPSSDLLLSADFHNFTADQPAGDADTFGNEVDLTLNYRYNTRFSIVSGFSLFLPDDLVKASLGEETATWFYVMTMVGF